MSLRDRCAGTIYFRFLLKRDFAILHPQFRLIDDEPGQLNAAYLETLWERMSLQEKSRSLARLCAKHRSLQTGGRRITQRVMNARNAPRHARLSREIANGSETAGEKKSFRSFTNLGLWSV